MEPGDDCANNANCTSSLCREHCCSLKIETKTTGQNVCNKCDEKGDCVDCDGISARKMETCDTTFLATIQAGFPIFGTSDFGHPSNVYTYFGIDLENRTQGSHRTKWATNLGKPDNFELASFLNDLEFEYLKTLIEQINSEPVNLWTAGHVKNNPTDVNSWTWKLYDNIEEEYGSMCFQKWQEGKPNGIGMTDNKMGAMVTYTKVSYGADLIKDVEFIDKAPTTSGAAIFEYRCVHGTTAAATVRLKCVSWRLKSGIFEHSQDDCRQNVQKSKFR